MAAVHLIQCYCVPSLTYAACEIWQMTAAESHKVNVQWNSIFRRIFNCLRESTSGLQFYCNSLPMNFIIDQHAVLFHRRIMNSYSSSTSTIQSILHALLRTKQCRVLSLLAKYNILSLSSSQQLIKSCIWNSFVTKSVRAGHISVSA